jgi:uncharacterized protein
MKAAALLRQARLDAELSQAALARAAGTSQAAVARYESGATEPALKTLERLLAACGRRLVLDAEPATALRALSASVVNEKRRELLALARRHGARNVRVFGSTARGEAGPKSDVDLLVELDSGRTLLDLIALRREATALLGRQVDVTTAEMLRDPVRHEAERDAVPV